MSKQARMTNRQHEELITKTATAIGETLGVMLPILTTLKLDTREGLLERA